MKLPLFFAPLVALGGALLAVLPAVSAVPPRPPLDLLRAREVTPAGWIREQMRLDLHEGITGRYDQISDNVAGRLFATRPRRPGTLVVGNRGLQEKAWWAGEHEGYWKDSIVRLAFLTGDVAFIDKARGWIEEILAAQQADGYIGIYTADARFPAKGFDGELWTQSRIFQAMLAYHEFTGDRRVLQAVERAVRCTLDAYRNRTYFHRPNPDGGVVHGIGYLDTLEWLYRLTGQDDFREGALWLYRDFARDQPAFLTDLLPQSLADANRLWRDHTPHIMEGLHLPVIAYALGGDELHRRAADNALLKLARHSNPGGGIVGSENVDGRVGSGHMPAEYCSLTEGASSLNRIVAWSGRLAAGAFVERLSLNAAQGSRFHPANIAVTYLNCDNQQDASDPAKLRGRFIYSASHKTAACCPLNAGRLLPYYVEGMWYRDLRRPGLVVNLYGPCEVRTRVAEVDVRIGEETEFPFSDQVRFTVEPAQPVQFPLVLRIPEGAGEIAVEAGPEARVVIDRAAGELTIEARWRGRHVVKVNFNFTVVRRAQSDGAESWYQWGPLVFSLPLPEKIAKLEELVTVSGKKSGFYDYSITAAERTAWTYRIDPAATLQVMKLAEGDRLHPWACPPIGLRGRMRTAAGEPVEVTLLPYGAAKMRRTTFPVWGEDKAAAVQSAGVVGRAVAHAFSEPVTKGVIYVEFTWQQLTGPLAGARSGIELTGEGLEGSFAGRPFKAAVFGLAGRETKLSNKAAQLHQPVKLIVKYDLDRGQAALWVDPDTTRVESTYPPDAVHADFRARRVNSVDTQVGPGARTAFGAMKVFTHGRSPFGD